MKVFEYPAVRVRQMPDGPWLVLFAAPAPHVKVWGGIPQKAAIGSTENLGFQRVVAGKRLRELAAFNQHASNTMPLPILVAQRSLDQDAIEFISDSRDDRARSGILRISVDDLATVPLKEMLRQIKTDLEERIPELTSAKTQEDLLDAIRISAGQPQTSDSDDNESDDSESDDSNGADGESNDTESEDVAAVVEESHIADFWQDIAARLQVLEEIEQNGLSEAIHREEFAGYSKDALASFVKPIIVVDGQHRLEGALLAVDNMMDGDEETRTRVFDLQDAGRSEEEADREVRASLTRHLPISLLLSPDPAEHVFQFVIVNQKATPIRPPLLGTIISTTLSPAELATVTERLETSGIKVELARAVNWVGRDPRSPFCGLVQTGLSFGTDPGKALPYTVARGLVIMFRDLQGGQLFGERPDYARKWRNRELGDCPLVAGWQSKGYDNPFEYWRDEVYRDVFVAFWKKIRDDFAHTEDESAQNYWGNPRISNLFCMPSLRILAADFFQFLTDRRLTIDNIEGIGVAVDEWLAGVDRTYFARDWNLKGIKKDTAGIKNNWRKLWVEYRKDPGRLPQTRRYRQAI